MKNTYLIAILFLVAGLVVGQFLDLNISGQEGSASKAPIIKDLKNLKPIEDYSIIEIPDGHRQYYCSNGTISIYIESDGDDSGSINYEGIILGCSAISGNWA